MAQVLVKSSPNHDRVEQLSQKIKSCELCQDLVKSRTQAVSGYGDFFADIFIIGEAPGRFGADVTGIPFTRDRSGIFLQKMLCKIGLNDAEPDSERPKLKGVYITNIVRCNPRNLNGTNRPPSKEEITNCMNYLEKELEIINPRLVITLGLPASKVILGKDFNGKDFGKIKKIEKFFVLPLWHPAFVIRGGGIQRMNEKRYSKFFIKIKKFIRHN